jgi:hypothetical protein
LTQYESNGRTSLPAWVHRADWALTLFNISAGLVQFEPTSQALLVEQMGNKFLREKGKTQRLVVAAIEPGRLRYKVREMARKISTLAISYWHFPK